MLFVVTVFAVPPGLWLFPNLFEDVGVIDSFKPLWGWQPEVCSPCLILLAWLLIEYRVRRSRRKLRKLPLQREEMKPKGLLLLRPLPQLPLLSTPAL